MIDWIDILRGSALLIASNATPVIVAKLLRDRWSAPMDFALTLWDGERLFGAHKTWRGALSGAAACAAVAYGLQLPWWSGAAFGTISLAGDALSSAIKRRLRLRPGAEILLLDQLGEALAPLLLLADWLSLNHAEIALTVAAFIALDVVFAPLRHRRWLR